MCPCAEAPSPKLTLTACGVDARVGSLHPHAHRRAAAGELDLDGRRRAGDQQRRGCGQRGLTVEVGGEHLHTMRARAQTAGVETCGAGCFTQRSGLDVAVEHEVVAQRPVGAASGRPGDERLGRLDPAFGQRQHELGGRRRRRRRDDRGVAERPLAEGDQAVAEPRAPDREFCRLRRRRRRSPAPSARRRPGSPRAPPPPGGPARRRSARPRRPRLRGSSRWRRSVRRRRTGARARARPVSPLSLPSITRGVPLSS